MYLKISLAFFILLLGFHSQAQIITTKNKSSLTITSGTLFHAGGINLIPDSPFTIKGENALNRITSVLHPAGKVFVARVFEFSNITDVFHGKIHFSYHDSEINRLNKSGFELQIHNGSNWRPMQKINHDQLNNILASVIPSVNLNKITLIDRQSLITNRVPLSVQVLTNPVRTGQITLLLDKDYELGLFTNAGQLLEVKKIAMGWHSWNVRKYAKGVYYIANPGNVKAIPVILL